MKIEKRQIHKTILTSLERCLGEDWKIVSKKTGEAEFLQDSFFPIQLSFTIDSIFRNTPTSPPLTNCWRVSIGSGYHTLFYNEYTGYLGESERVTHQSFPLRINKTVIRIIPEQDLLVYSQEDLDSCMPIVYEYATASKCQLPRFQRLEEFDDMLAGC